MGHAHEHHADGSYYTEQLCTIGICGAMGAVCVVMATTKDKLDLILAPAFHPYVLWGGIALLVTVVVRAACVWKTVGASQHAHAEHDHNREHDCCGVQPACDSHDHDHAHDHAHGHEHHHHDHAHDHEHAHTHADAHAGHDHSWNPWRYAVLLLPITLFFLGLPNKELSADTIAEMLDTSAITKGAANFSSEVGIQVVKDDGAEFPRVGKVGKDFPADKAGVRDGDLITRVANDTGADGKPLPTADVTETKGLAAEKVLEKLHGKSGTKVTLTVQRAGADKPLDVEVTRDSKVITLEFKELERAAFSPMAREHYTGRRGRLKGQFFPMNDNVFRLIKKKVTCCQADMTVTQVLIEAPESIKTFQNDEWLEVEGQIRFDQVGNKYVAVLGVASMDKIQKTKPESDTWVQQQ